jgi:Amt family ammonium transporter
MGPDGVDGLFIGWGSEGLSQMGLQIIGLTATWAYAFSATILIALILKVTMGLRTTEAQEDAGLDQSLHGEAGYSLETASTLK